MAGLAQLSSLLSAQLYVETALKQAKKNVMTVILQMGTNAQINAKLFKNPIKQLTSNLLQILCNGRLKQF